MNSKVFSELASKCRIKIEQTMTVRKFYEGIGAAAALGVVTGMIIARKSGSVIIWGVRNNE